jgi:polar amino acid transport system substrate-binding protein
MVRQSFKSRTGALKPAVGLALAATSLLALSACSDPGAAASANAPAATNTATSSAKTFNLTPEQDRFPVTVDQAAAALVPEAIKKDGKLTVAVSPFAPPLAVYATDNKTPVGNEVDIAVALAQTLGLEAEIVPTAWADWPLGVESGKYEAVLSNVTVTEERKLKFDFASYRDDKLGFYAKSGSDTHQGRIRPRRRRQARHCRLWHQPGIHPAALGRGEQGQGAEAGRVPVLRRRLRLEPGAAVRPRGPDIRAERHRRL